MLLFYHLLFSSFFSTYNMSIVPQKNTYMVVVFFLIRQIDTEMGNGGSGVVQNPRVYSGVPIAPFPLHLPSTKF